MKSCRIFYRAIPRELRCLGGGKIVYSLFDEVFVDWICIECLIESQTRLAYAMIRRLPLVFVFRKDAGGGSAGAVLARDGVAGSDQRLQDARLPAAHDLAKDFGIGLSERARR